MVAGTLNGDAQVIALACSPTEAAADVRPLSAAEWDDLSVRLHASDFERPKDLLRCDLSELRDGLGITQDAAVRLEALLSRGGQLAFEVERLASLGIWILTRADDLYPRLLRKRLGRQAPPLLFGAGDPAQLTAEAIAVVGSRDVTDDCLDYALALGRRCAAASFAVVSGAARGVDRAAMNGASSAGGVAIGVTVDPLERLVRRREDRERLTDGGLTFVTPFHPSARWHASNAMRRNRLIYALSQAAVVVATSAGSGGTWTGAMENLKHRWVPLHVRDDGTVGPRALVAEGGRRLPDEVRDIASLVVGEPSLFDPQPVVDPDATTAPYDDASVETAAMPRSLFDVVWPQLERYLHEPRSLDDVAGRFELVRSQAKSWLTHASDEGLVIVSKRPQRYVITGADQPALFDPGSSGR